MIFNSLHYLIFFPIVCILYFLLPAKYRNALLLVASYYFYMSWNPIYVLLILTSTAVTYFCGIVSSKYERYKKASLVTAIVVCIGILFAFKYMNFFIESLNQLLGIAGVTNGIPVFHVLLPVGISFYTFQSLSYAIDVYRGRQKVEKNFFTYALYISFFPQLVAGPIERSTALLPQFGETHNFDYARISDGLKMMLWGFFKKVVIADRVAVFVNTVYNNPQDHGGLQFIVATLFFAIQIYCDFSGYSDIAIGSAQIMGFKLMQNFDRPYFASSIIDFWNRWHISLSTWFRDYIYIPLGGNRVSKLRRNVNVMVTFLVSGLWHGANWTYVLWGAYHGILNVANRTLRDLHPLKSENLFSKVSGKAGTLLKGVKKFGKIIVTFSLVCFGWIVFRSKNIKDCLYIFRHLMDGFTQWFSYSYIYQVLGGLGIKNEEFFFCLLMIGLLLLVELFSKGKSFHGFLQNKPYPIRVAVCMLFFYLVIYKGAFNVTSNFIYFQF